MKQLTKNQLKILAMVCMTLDHIGAAFFPQAVWLRVIGRLAFPLFSYCIAEGCRYTRNKARYFGSVFACGAVCVIAFLPFGGFCGNALITLSLSILLLYGMEAWKSSGKLRFLALTAALAAVFYLLCRTVPIDYGFAGVLLPLYAEAGRLSSTDPNLQNIPVRTELGRELRRMFVAPDENHVLIDADYSQIELRVLAHISQDEHMIEAFKHGQDIHAATAAKVYHVPLEEVTPQMRSSCKAVNFGIVYGISDFSLAQDIGVTRKEAGEFIKTYLDTYPGVKKYMEDIKQTGREQGYVSTLFGRRRALPELKSKNFNMRSFGERVAMNTPIQGTAADIIKIAMVRVRDRLLRDGLQSRLILQVHDELILEAPKDEQETAMHLLTEEMENAFRMDAPLVAEAKAGHSWYDAK